ncbi:hypothetical protein THAOC_25927, partial [Thalassiosira oceanica]
MDCRATIPSEEHPSDPARYRIEAWPTKRTPKKNFSVEAKRGDSPTSKSAANLEKLDAAAPRSPRRRIRRRRFPPSLPRRPRRRGGGRAPAASLPASPRRMDGGPRSARRGAAQESP